MLSLADLRFVAFALLACFTSSMGQTYFVAIFGGEFRAEFGLTNGRFGTIDSAATLMSGFSIMWLGGLVDRVPLRMVAAAVTLGLAGACALVAVAPAACALGLALFGLRLCGQGLMIHLAVTSMARYFDRTRGRMTALALLGLPLAEASLPRLTVDLLDQFPWRTVWLGGACILVLIILPLLQLCLLGHGRRHERWLEGQRVTVGTEALPPITRSALLRHRSFRLLLPALAGPPFIVTWIFFHQVPLTAAKGWSLELFATSVAAYAAASVAATLLSGVLVDRLGAKSLLPFYLLPLGLGCLVLATGEHWLACPLGLALIGLANGANGTVMTSVWAELYGVAALGLVRGVATSIGIVASALSPGLVGVVIDRSVPFAAILLVSTSWVLAASVAAWRVQNGRGSTAVAVR